MELSHLLELVSELPKGSTLSYVRGTDTCRFVDVDIQGERINAESPTKEPKSWAPSYLGELAPKIRENEPFNLSGLLNNKGSFRPVLETIIAHTREFYTVRIGTATALVWIPTKPKLSLDLVEIEQTAIPAPVDSESTEVCMAIMNPLKDSFTDGELVDELRKMYDALGTTGVHLFGLKFGKYLAGKQVKDLSTIASAAGIPESFGAELNKLRNLYQAIHEHKFGLSFYDEIRLSSKDLSSASHMSDLEFSYLRAMRTKPFLLLAGISGTGKSRVVKQMAFDSCPDIKVLRSDKTSPGNYCLVEVKPNWHDSTELIGYESQIGSPHYQLTPFVKFLAKAMLYPDVPFFLCLDEMNLAPVEQYFAEFLSVLESRTKVDGHIVSEPLIKAGIFANKDYELTLQDDLFGLEIKEETTADGSQRIVSGRLSDEAQRVYDSLKTHGLRIPENVIVIGTVNMDETTHQFSRKVIDRAMTIEMNLPEGKNPDGTDINPFLDFFKNSSKLDYRTPPTSASLYIATEIKASDVVEVLSAADADKTDWLKGEVAAFLTGLNGALDGTPFKVAYRVQNELMLYFHQLWLEKDRTDEWDELLAISCDQILMMKVLPRIEGDDELLEKPLARLAEFCEPYPNAQKKIQEMTYRLGQSRFASFWP